MTRLDAIRERAVRRLACYKTIGPRATVDTELVETCDLVAEAVWLVKRSWPSRALLDKDKDDWISRKPALLRRVEEET